MQPSLTLVSVATPLLGLALWTIPGQADSRNFQISELPPLPDVKQAVETDTSQVWFQASKRVALASLAETLDLPLLAFARSNRVTTGHVFQQGEWIRFESASHRDLLELAALDPDSISGAAPLMPPPPIPELAEAEPTDSLNAFLTRQGITASQFKTANPVMGATRAVAKRDIRVAKAFTGQNLLAIRPITSGGASFPDTPLRPLRGFPSFSSKTYMWPTKGVFTSGYGWRWGRMHKGIDIANNTGTPILASRAGVVAYSGWRSGYGYLVEIEHSDGESTRYAHNSRLLVKKGQIVPQGTRISLMGSTGRSTGPHLHFEIRRAGGGAMNPLGRLPARKA